MWSTFFVLFSKVNARLNSTLTSHAILSLGDIVISSLPVFETLAHTLFSFIPMREDLIASAVTFLNDPQVADSSMAKRVEFLESKGLSKEEIEEAVKRAGSRASSASVPPASGVPGSSITSGYGYPVNSNPPPLPKRDWKDYFVMATVTAGVAYGLYEVANRYVLPLIMPPTPQALEADKKALETEFARTEALLEQIQKDTEEMKIAEQERKDKFAQILEDTEKAVQTAKAQTQQREIDMKLIKSQVEGIKDTLPKALEKHRQQQDKALSDLQDELKSLKQLISNRVSSSAAPPVISASAVPGRASPGVNSIGGNSITSVPAVPVPSGGSGTTTPRVGIPAWQLGAASKSKEAEAST